MNFLQQTPFFRLLLPFIIGILFFQHLPDISFKILCAVFVLSVLLFFFSSLINKTNYQYSLRWVFGCGIFLFLFALAYVICEHKEQGSLFDSFGKKGVFIVELTAAPVEKERSILCNVELLQYLDASEWTTAKGNAILYIQRDSMASELRFGDRLLIETEFSPPQKPLNPDGFDYANYLHRQGIGATSYISSERWEKVDSNPQFSLFRLANQYQSFLLQIFKDFGIDGDEYAVLAALTLGYTDALNPDIRESYNATGAVHILSVSGLHVGIVYGAIALLLSFLNRTKRQRIIKSIFIILFLWAYAFITGLSPSVMRSAFMFSFVAFATCLNRQSQIYNTILMSAFFMLVVNPNYLFDIGFQLSYSAVISIILFTVPARKVLKTKNRLAHWSWDMLSVSIAAQLGTVPFILYYFHQFPVYFLLTNFLAIPLSSGVIYCAIALLIISPIPYLSDFTAHLLDASLWLLNNSITFIQHLPGSLAFVAVNEFQMWLLVGVIIAFTAFYRTKRFNAIALGLAAILLIAISNMKTHYDTITSNKMLVYAGQQHTHISFISGYNNWIYSENINELERLAKAFWQNNKLSHPREIRKSQFFYDNFITFGNKKIFVLEDNALNGKTRERAFDVDYLILGENTKPRMQDILACIAPRQVIICKGISNWYTENIKEHCLRSNIPCYSIGESGAFIVEFD